MRYLLALLIVFAAAFAEAQTRCYRTADGSLVCERPISSGPATFRPMYRPRYEGYSYQLQSNEGKTYYAAPVRRGRAVYSYRSPSRSGFLSRLFARRAAARASRAAYFSGYRSGMVRVSSPYYYRTQRTYRSPYYYEIVPDTETEPDDTPDTGPMLDSKNEKPKLFDFEKSKKPETTKSKATVPMAVTAVACVPERAKATVPTRKAVAYVPPPSKATAYAVVPPRNTTTQAVAVR